jgi:hypothetical protein
MSKQQYWQLNPGLHYNRCFRLSHDVRHWRSTDQLAQLSAVQRPHKQQLVLFISHLSNDSLNTPDLSSKPCSLVVFKVQRPTTSGTENKGVGILIEEEKDIIGGSRWSLEWIYTWMLSYGWSLDRDGRERRFLCCSQPTTTDVQRRNRRGLYRRGSLVAPQPLWIFCATSWRSLICTSHTIQLFFWRLVSYEPASEISAKGELNNETSKRFPQRK